MSAENDNTDTEGLRRRAAVAGIHDAGQFSDDELRDALRRREAGQDPRQAASQAKGEQPR